MFRSRADRGRSHSPTRERQARPWLAKALNPASLLPGMVIGFLLGLLVELPKGGFRGSSVPAKKGSGGSRNMGSSSSSDEGGELKMVFVVRQDLKMGSGKIASQCAHAATGTYNELLSRNRALLKRWEDCGQPKIVVTCKNQKEMNELRGRADGAGLPTYTVADAGRTQVAAGSKTVLVIGPDVISWFLLPGDEDDEPARQDKRSAAGQAQRGRSSAARQVKRRDGRLCLEKFEGEDGSVQAGDEGAAFLRARGGTRVRKDGEYENCSGECACRILHHDTQLETALATIEKAMSECETVTTPDECEELLAATQLIAQVKPIFADLPS